MSYQIIDMTNDPRSGQFAYFRQMLFPFAGVTAEVDITDFAARRQGRPSPPARRRQARRLRRHGRRLLWRRWRRPRKINEGLVSF